MAALMAGEAQAQQRRDDIPAMAYAALVDSSNDRSTVQQEGAGNGAAIVQNGRGNTAGIRQFGRNNSGAITQNGDNNTACLIQIGRNLDGSITQNGDYNSVGVIQTRPRRNGDSARTLLGAARQWARRARRHCKTCSQSRTPITEPDSYDEETTSTDVRASTRKRRRLCGGDAGAPGRWVANAWPRQTERSSGP
jgi:hypothetical protein